jgi:hypothetical protein
MFITTPDCQGIDFRYNDNGEVLDGQGKPQNVLSEELLSIEYHIRKFLVKNKKKPFIPLLTNFFDNASFNSADLSLNTIDIGENRFGARQTLAGNLMQSQANLDVSIDFQEVSGIDYQASNPLPNLMISKLHKAWMSYIEAVRLGTLFPGYPYTFSVKDGNTSLAALKRRINYVSTIYFFKLDADGKTINFWSQYAGVYPKNPGLDNFDGGKREPVKVSINYQSQWYEPLNIFSLHDFNLASGYHDSPRQGAFSYNEKDLREGNAAKIDKMVKSNLPFITFNNTTKRYELNMPENR